MDIETQTMQALLRMSPKIITNTTIDTNTPIVYHISPVDNIREFIPRIVKRKMPKEDLTVPRVCTAPTILDCIRGYAVTVDDYLQKNPTTGAAGVHEWRGGYYIYAIPNSVNLIVNSVLAPIAKWCDERWLINVTSNRQRYSATCVGQFFYTRANGEEHADVMIYLRIYNGMVKFDNKIDIGKGCHAIEVKAIDAYYRKGSLTRVGSHNTITLGEYLSAKSEKADLLSYTPPAWAAWG